MGATGAQLDCTSAFHGRSEAYRPPSTAPAGTQLNRPTPSHPHLRTSLGQARVVHPIWGRDFMQLQVPSADLLCFLGGAGLKKWCKWYCPPVVGRVVP